MKNGGLFLLILAFLVISGCSTTAGNDQITSTPALGNEETELEPEVLADCAWSATVIAWIDNDGNGVHDDSEPPLENVEFMVNDVLNQFENVGYGISAYDGVAITYVWLPGCPDAQFEIEANPPEGYTLTTESPVQVTGAGYGDETGFEFGFKPDVATVPTQNVQRYTCKSYELPSMVLDVEDGPDGTVWATDFQILYRFDIAEDRWLPLERPLAAPDDGGLWDDIRFDASGNIWLNSWDRTLFYDGQYHSYDDPDSLQVVAVPPEARSPDGTLWFMKVTFGGPVFTYNPTTGVWAAYERPSLIENTFVSPRVASNGDQWFMEVETDWKKFNSIQDDGFDWQVIDPEQFTKKESKPVELSGFVSAIRITEQGIVWMADEAGVLRYNPATDQWTRFNGYDQGINQFQGAQDMTIAPDGSIWIASGERLGIVIQIVPLSDETNDAEWYVYDTRNGIPDLGRLERIAAGSDGSIWLGRFVADGNYSPVLSRCRQHTP